MAGRKTYFWDVIDKYNQRNANGPISVQRIQGPVASMYTGGGPDKVVQPDRPALIDTSNGNFNIVHEGEIMKNHPSGGKQVIPNKDVRRGIIPLTTNKQQQIVSEIENGAQMKDMLSYRGGGMINPYKHGGMIHAYQDGGIIPPQGQQPQRNAIGVSQTPLTQALGQQPQAQPQMQPTPPTVAQQTGLTAQPQAAPQQPAQQQPQQYMGMGMGIQPPAPQQPQQPQQQGQQQPVADPNLPFEKQPLTPDNMQKVLSGQQEEFKTVGDMQKYIQKNLLQLQKIAQGDSELFERLKNTMLGQLGNVHAAQQAAQSQEALQQGLSPELTRVVGQQQDRQRMLERGNLMNQLAEQEASAAVNATNQAVQQGLAVTQFEIAQKKDKLNTLIKQGGLKNLQEAEQVFAELYGTPIDIERLKNSQILSDISDVAALGLGVEESIQMAQQQGILERYNLTEDELRNTMTSMIVNSNPIVKAQTMYNDLVSQGVITQDQAEQAILAMEWSLLNPQGVEISNSYVVTDENGNQVGNFKTEEEADAFISNNPQNNYNKSFKKNGWIGLAGSYEEYLGTNTEGDVFSQGGKLYRVVNGEKVPAQVTPTVPFSAVNNALYKYYIQTGKQDLANEVLNLQIDHLRMIADENGKIDVLPAGVTKDHPAYLAFMSGKKSNVGGFNTGGGTTTGGITGSGGTGQDTGETSGEGLGVETLEGADVDFGNIRP